MKLDQMSANETADDRAPYEAPQFECEELFEVLALACGKTTPTSDCISGPGGISNS